MVPTHPPHSSTPPPFSLSRLFFPPSLILHHRRRLEPLLVVADNELSLARFTTSHLPLLSSTTILPCRPRRRTQRVGFPGRVLVVVRGGEAAKFRGCCVRGCAMLGESTRSRSSCRRRRRRARWAVVLTKTSLAPPSRCRLRRSQHAGRPGPVGMGRSRR